LRAQRLDLAAQSQDIRVILAVDRRVPDELPLQHLQPIRGAQERIALLVEHDGVRAELRELRLEQRHALAQITNLRLDGLEVALGAIEQRHVHVGELRQPAGVVSLELGERGLPFGNLLLEPTGLRFEELQGFRRELLARALVLAEIERDEVVGDRVSRGRGRVTEADAEGDDAGIGGDQGRNELRILGGGDDVTPQLARGFARLELGIRIVLLRDRAEVLVRQHALGDAPDPLIGKVRDRGPDDILWNLGLLDEEYAARLVHGGELEGERNRDRQDRSGDQREQPDPPLQDAYVILEGQLGFACFLHRSSSLSERPARAAPSRLRDHHHVAAFEQDVLLEVAAPHYVVEAKRQCNLPAILAPKNENIVRRGERGRSSGDAEGLHHVDTRIHHELARVVHLTEHVNLVAVDLADGDRDDEPWDVAGEPVRD